MKKLFTMFKFRKTGLFLNFVIKYYMLKYSFIGITLKPKYIKGIEY